MEEQNIELERQLQTEKESIDNVTAQDMKYARDYLSLMRKRSDFATNNKLSGLQLECVIAMGSEGYVSNMVASRNLSYDETKNLRGIHATQLTALMPCGESTISSSLIGLAKKGYVIRLSNLNNERVGRNRESFLSRTGTDLYHKAIKTLSSPEVRFDYRGLGD